MENQTQKKKPHKIQKAELYHEGFEIAVVLKGLGGLAEVLGSIALFFLKPSVMERLVRHMTRGMLQNEYTSWLAHYLITLSTRFTTSTQLFGVFYLASHGLVKLVLVGLLWKRKLWAYPLTIASLIAFIFYQIYCFAVKPSIGMVALTIFDLVMIWLTYKEYLRIKQSNILT